MASDEPQTQDPERAAVDHWRRLAERRGRELDALHARLPVRALLAVERRAAPYRVSVASTLGAAVARVQRRAGDALGRHRRRVATEALDSALGSRVDTDTPTERERATTLILGLELAELPDLRSAIASAPEGPVVLMAPGVEPAAPGMVGRLARVLDDAVAGVGQLVLPHDSDDRWNAGRIAERWLEIRWESPSLRRVPVGARGLVSLGSHRSETSHHNDTVGSAGRPPSHFVATTGALAVDRDDLLTALDTGVTNGAVGPADRLAELAVVLSAAGPVVPCPTAVFFDRRPTRETPAAVGRLGPRVRSHGRDQGSTIAVSVAVPSLKVAPEWGDWYLAGHLERAFSRRGFEVETACRDAVDSDRVRTCELHLVVRGLAPVEPTPGQAQVLWLISNPESVTLDELDRADLVLVASTRHAERLSPVTSTPVEVFLQATDSTRFAPPSGGPGTGRGVVAVAQARHTLRPAVAAALAHATPLTVHGQGWEDLIPAEARGRDYIPNDELASVYGSAAVVLNDHTPTMAAWGYASNRIFDVLACGTPVLSEHLDDVSDVFGDLVPTFSTQVEFGRHLDDLLQDPDRRREIGTAGRELIVTHHTFDHRVAEFVRLCRRHGLPISDGAGPQLPSGVRGI